MMRPRLVILNHEILPYRIPLFRALADDPQFELHVLYCARRGWDRSWTVPRDSPAFDHTAKPEYHIVEGQWTTGLLPQVSSLTSLQGGLLTTHEEEAKRFTVNGEFILLPDFQIKRLVLHTIDTVLMPPP
ncbi:MAG: fasciclin domain-containing protein [Chloroflexi bacterium]|nr:fasciclin domain-containing protein [Chloroflexota bacterium]